MPRVLQHSPLASGAVLQERPRHMREVQDQVRGLPQVQDQQDRLRLSGEPTSTRRLPCGSSSEWTIFLILLQVAASIIQRINHPCEFRDEGCNYRGDIASITGHEENCRYYVYTIKLQVCIFIIIMCTHSTVRILCSTVLLHGVILYVQSAWEARSLHCFVFYF